LRKISHIKMQYSIDDLLIKSENTAKPNSLQSNLVVDYLSSSPIYKNVLDFGCGKLRYFDELRKISRNLTLVDSMVQLSRKQRIHGEITTIQDYIYPIKNTKSIPYESLNIFKVKNDFVSCINVLSAIPSESVLCDVLLKIKNLLEEHGKLFVVNQFANSYFKRFEGGKKHLYGYIYSTRRGNFYYGLLDLKITRTLLEGNGFIVQKGWENRGRSFIEARIGK